MSNPHQDREFQRALLNHPAIVRQGVDPLWRWIAVTLMVLVAILVAAIAARGEGIKPELKNSEGKAVRYVATPQNADRLRALNTGHTEAAATKGSSEFLSFGYSKTLITERFLDALEEVESGRDAGAVGDHGRSLGSFQFKAVAWAQVNTLRFARGLETRSYLFYAKNRVTARLYAREYLGWLESNLTRALHRSPTHPELYAVWNLGPAGFRARGFDLRKCPAHVRRAAGRLKGGELRVERGALK